MKNKILWTALFCFLFFEMGFSQIRFGARAGLNRASVSDVHAGSKPRYGAQIGVIAQIPLSAYGNILFFEPEINYSMHGEFNQISSPQKVDQKIFLDYINVPLNIKLYFSDDDNQFFANLGPYVGYSISKTIGKFEFPTEPDNYKYKDFDAGVNLGLGYSFNRQLEVSVRYYLGFLDQVENDPGDQNNYNSTLNFGLAYFFGDSY